jgi:hypothetical protein
VNMFDEPEVKAGRKGMGSHQSARMLKDEWLTPPEIIDALGGAESFDLDPCAPINRKWPMAKQHYTIVDNGLLKPWHGRVWCNPPYGGPEIVGPWMRRLSDHGEGAALVFARTETELFFETIWRKAAAVFFFEGRLFFHVAVDSWFPRKDKEPIFVKAFDRAPANGGAPSCLVAFGDRDADILQGCGLRGQFVDLRGQRRG